MFADIISHIGVDNPTYIEPYAGGVGAGIALLREGLVSRLVINDIDPAVHAFWQAAVFDNAMMVEKALTVPLTIDEWRLQREVYRSGKGTYLELGFAFFYLNRTNRSGILNAGVIGGNDQSGNYKIDARFNRETLANRLRSIGALSDRIEVSNLDGRSVIQQYGDDPAAFLYIDPPYVQAGSQLYLNSFTHRDHEALAEAVHAIRQAHWIVTYDVAPLVTHLYSSDFLCELEINYSARHPGKASELLVASPEAESAITELFSASDR